MAFTYYSPVSINSGQVPSTQTDFPILVSFTDNRFKSVGNGGHVQSSSGFDIRPYTDTTLTTAITGYELERYNASTGEVIMWVKISSLTSSSTPLVLAYGNSSLTTDGSSTTTWSNSFKSVYHLKDGTTLSVADATGSVNGTNHSVTAAAGQIDGCGSFVSASSQYVDLSTMTTGTGGVTFSAWVNATSFPNTYNTPFGLNVSGNPTDLFVKSNGKLACYITATGLVNYDGSGSHTLSSSTWYLLHMTYSSSAGLTGYVNAASDGTGAANGNPGSGTSATIGQDPVTAGRFWNGLLDEVRVATTVRSANWITTEYNNQSAPGTFETLGSEVSVGGTGSANFLMFFN